MKLSSVSHLHKVNEKHTERARQLDTRFTMRKDLWPFQILLKKKNSLGKVFSEAVTAIIIWNDPWKQQVKSPRIWWIYPTLDHKFKGHQTKYCKYHSDCYANMKINRQSEPCHCRINLCPLKALFRPRREFTLLWRDGVLFQLQQLSPLKLS